MKDKTKDNKGVSILYTVLCGIFPIVSAYAIAGFPFGDLLLIFVLVLMVIGHRGIIRMHIWWLAMPYLCYLCLRLLLVIPFYHAYEGEALSIINRIGHNLLYLLAVVLLAKKYYSVDLAMKVQSITSVFATLYLIAQYVVLHVTGVYLSGKIPFLDSATIEEFELERRLAYGLDTATVRCRSIFSEPSGFGIYVGLTLLVRVFLFNDTKRQKQMNLFLTFGLLLSQSSTAILYAFFIWGAWYLYHLWTKQFSKQSFVLILLCGIALFLVFTQTPMYDTFISHTFGKGHNGTVGRVGNYQLAFSTEGKEIKEILFGNNMVRMEYYIPDLPRLFYYFGVVGFFIWSVLPVGMVVKASDFLQRMVAVFMILLSVFGTCFLGSNQLFMFPLYLTVSQYRKDAM